VNFLRGLGIAIVSLVVVVASLLFIGFSICAIGGGISGSDRGVSVIIALIDLAVIIGGVHALKKLHRWNAE
jgi:hypothetical protein